MTMIKSLIARLFNDFTYIRVEAAKVEKVGLASFSYLPFSQLYRHQLEVVKEILNKNNVFLASPTSSGKTLAFALAYSELKKNYKDATMLVIYPRKALSRDQVISLNNLYSYIPHMHDVRIMPVDGDVSPEMKRQALMYADVIVSNPYGIHVYMSYHGEWARFLTNLDLVVVDETHLYSGVFGTHVSYVLRRLKRLAASYGSVPRFLFLSATVEEPAYSGFSLIGEKFKEIVVDGFSMEPKDLYFAKLPSGDKGRVLTSLIGTLTDYGYRGMVFFNSRDEMERTYYKLLKSEYKDVIAPYRAGYSPEERRKIEMAMREGDVSFLLTTSAMELGIDIGDIDVTIMHGFPSTGFSSFWQRAGRAGRKNAGYVITLLKPSNALDMYVYEHPDIVLRRKGESLYIDVENRDIAMKQIRCASWEKPLLPERDKEYFPPSMIDSFIYEEKEKLWDTGNGYVLMDSKPHFDVSLDEGDSETFYIVDLEKGDVIEKVEMWRIFKKHYPGSTYFYMGNSYKVSVVDLDRKVVGVERSSSDTETMPIGWEDVVIKNTLTSKKVGRTTVYLGVLEIQSYLLGYSDRLGVYMFNGAMYRKFQTKGVWFYVSKDDLDVGGKMVSLHIPSLGLSEITFDDMFAGSLHALEHILINVLPIISISSEDVGGYSIPSIYKHYVDDITFPPQIYVESRQTFPRVSLNIKDRSAVYIYDGHPGGVGIAERIFEKFSDIAKYAASRIDECSCKKGCPACIMSHQCGNGNRPLNKLGSRSLLSSLFLL